MMKFTKKKFKPKFNSKYLTSIFTIGIFVSLFACSFASALGYEYVVNDDFSNINSINQYTIIKTPEDNDDPYYPSTFLNMYTDTGIAFDTHNKLQNTSWTYNLDFQIRGNWPSEPPNVIGVAWLLKFTEGDYFHPDGSTGSYDFSFNLKRNATADGNIYYLYCSKSGGNAFVYNLYPHTWYSLTVTSQYNATNGNNVLNAYLYDPYYGGNHHFVENYVFTWHTMNKPHWINIGPYAYGSPETCGNMYIDNLILQYYDTSVPTLPPESGTDPSLSKIVWQIVFFLPAIILVQFFGRIGIIIGIGIMTIVFIVSQPDFIWAGIMILLSLGIYGYRGGL